MKDEIFPLGESNDLMREMKEGNESLNDTSEKCSALQDYVWRKKTRYQSNDKPDGDTTLEVPWDQIEILSGTKFLVKNTVYYKYFNIQMFWNEK